MFRSALLFGLTVTLALAGAPIANATPADSQFLSDITYAVRGGVSRSNAQSLISTAINACRVLIGGANSTQAMDYVSRALPGAVNDPIGFMAAATRAYCPAYFSSYDGA